MRKVVRNFTTIFPPLQITIHVKTRLWLFAIKRIRNVLTPERVFPVTAFLATLTMASLDHAKTSMNVHVWMKTLAAPGATIAANWKSVSTRLAHSIVIAKRDSLEIKATIVLVSLRKHGVAVRVFGLYYGSNRFESLSPHNCWALSKCFIPSLVA